MVGARTGADIIAYENDEDDFALLSNAERLSWE